MNGKRKRGDFVKFVVVVPSVGLVLRKKGVTESFKYHLKRL